MSDRPLITAIEALTDVQRKTVNWTEDAMLVLAGPGSGKTQVLTCRIAQLLDSSPDKNYRVLALTFTNKAADEMKQRVTNFVPGLEERATIGTFHSFCGQVLRLHGVHVGIRPDFTIYSQDADRKAVFEDALKRASAEDKTLSGDEVRYLGLIDRMKAHLIEPKDAEERLARLPDKKLISLAYRAYQEELNRLNILDFNSLIFEAYRLFSTYPTVAARYRRSYPYWLLDEFQDTNNAQFRLIRAMAGDDFRNVFAVADDDQIIYQWNGASFRQIQCFRAEFSAEVVQLPTNYRCPPVIVEAANRLVAYNVQRTETKKPLLAGKTDLKLPESEHIQIREFNTEEEESEEIAKEISERGLNQWGQITVIARTRALLVRMHKALRAIGVSAVVAQRRDDFLSAEFRWLVACLVQTLRPLDQRNIEVLIEAFNRISGLDVAIGQVRAEAEAIGESYFSIWLKLARSEIGCSGKSHLHLLESIGQLVQDPTSARKNIDEIVSKFDSLLSEVEEDADLSEDLLAWREISKDIAQHIGRDAPLDQFLQQLQLRSKERSPGRNTVSLMTVHGAKGREFEIVYVIGLAEDIMPSYHSLRKGDESPEMEEERRNCFVAITRAKECLILSRANRYRDWMKQPSRFLVEMELA